jgi:integrase
MITTQQVNNFFSRICKKLNIVCDGQHSLRHTFTTRAREVELDPDKLKDILGHSNIHMTMDVYNKNSLDSLRSGMEKVNEYYKKLFN